jgi:hypothetical protein
MSLHDALNALGLASRKTFRLENSSNREVYNPNTGETLGAFDAAAGWGLVKRLRNE